MKHLYIVFRVYTKKERPNKEDRVRLYGYTFNRAVLDGFMEQRTKGKYTYQSIDVEDQRDDGFIWEIEGLSDTQVERCEIDIARIPVANSKDYISLFTTKAEMIDASIEIQKYKESLCSLESIPGTGNYLEMYNNLAPYYMIALDYLGYRPKEIDIMCDSADPNDDYSGIEHAISVIENDYDNMDMCHYTKFGDRLPGVDSLRDPVDRILYTIQNFIKVLRDDL